jgi:hypothetical protein
MQGVVVETCLAPDVVADPLDEVQHVEGASKIEADRTPARHRLPAIIRLERSPARGLLL